MASTQYTYIWEGIYSCFSEVNSSSNPYNKDNDTWAEMLLESLGAAVNCINSNRPISTINTDEKSLLPFLVSVISKGKSEPVSILDFGGGIGVDFLYVRQCLGNEKIGKYYIVETENVCELGSEVFKKEPRVEFHSTVPETKVDIVFLDSSLQYIEDYRDLILKLARCRPDYFLFLRTPAGNVPTYVTAQMNVPGSVIPCRFINIQELVSFMETCGYHLEFYSFSDRPYDQANFPPEYRLGNYKTMLFNVQHKETRLDSTRPTPPKNLNESFYFKNLCALQSSQPILAQQLVESNQDDNLQVVLSRSGHAVPVLNSNPFHSLENPVIEGEAFASQNIHSLSQERVLFFGFGFGYHIFSFVAKGLSPIIVEPSIPLFKLALMHMDLTSIIPFATFFIGSQLPDIPRKTKIFWLDVATELFPNEAAEVSRKVLNEAPKTDDVEEGVYNTSYRNITCLKNPCDLAVYQMLIYLVKPTLIIEIGTCRGGSALYFADLLQTLGDDRQVHTFDIVNDIAPEALYHPNITFHPGGWKTFDPSMISPHDRVLVIEDSAHTYENSIQVLNTFAPFVTPNSYFIVEDGAAGLVRPEFNGGALRAVEEFMHSHHEYELDYTWEKFYGTGSSSCLKGFLRRKPQ